MEKWKCILVVRHSLRVSSTLLVSKHSLSEAGSLKSMVRQLALDAQRKDKLVADFKRVYLKSGPTDLQGQVPFLSRLAEHYESLGVSSGNDWTHLLKVCL